MRYSVRLVSLESSANRKLIVKRLAGDLRTDIKKAEAFAGSLPLILFTGLSAEKADSVMFDYQRMGCRIERFMEEEKAATPEHHETIHSHIAATPEHQDSLAMPQFSFSSGPGAPEEKPGRRREIIVIAAFLLFIAGVLAASHFRKSIAPATHQLQQAEREARENPTDQKKQQHASRAYTEKAQEQQQIGDRIRFYQIAIAFNKFNETAWDGLIDAYAEKGEDAKANQTRREKMAIFGDTNAAIARIIASYGALQGTLKLTGSGLQFTYATDADGDSTVENEMKTMAGKIREIRPFEEISMTAVGDTNTITGKY
ncbi:MAG: hypothetical protein A2350_13065 [Candidatus Raymondbacteria bacterium RifOxyB12_full_50_8]|uniref:Uncharacterized protein n=1 Tax=Candidatus Raymondbacteria bacterium RIFOXYD12_FULL_49_13 TaxID=1817890 RepID=A0A1F7F0D6_UNCRA|nr:MAG: hypothetical protein A2248_21830 [Candidatus Raymondbacteria bacterium RIFOXYA2_FULL_49_16]OGK00078.1 MAG: hypothetical protein A2519_22385 [Candidatus Raymondbacteria bacterium RIFOXYD12_FULL_49_13]OGK03695.1 MAG: hypothetical protein A2350_13065 [Candidatus Raymondbacteria bacterium RifOxyB12_full_50_8]OGP45067.1 MAG: hypothetical protein A2324_13710 [Candidatus Raymondbacteria bacterium RIFOXYB2_FULL_49_35]